MDKTDYHDKMDALVNDNQTFEELKRDPTPALQRKLNSTLLTLKKTNAIDTQRYYRLRCSVPQPPKLYGLPKLHKSGFSMRPIVSFCGSPTYQLSKYLTTILQPLTDKSRRKLQSTEDFINATKTVQITDDYNKCHLMWNRSLQVFHSGTTMYWDCYPTIYRPYTAAERGHYGLTTPLLNTIQCLKTKFIRLRFHPSPDINLLSVQRQTLQTVSWYSYGVSSFCCCIRSCDAEHRGKHPFDLPTDDATLVTLSWRYFHRRTTRRNRRILPPP